MASSALMRTPKGENGCGGTPKSVTPPTEIMIGANIQVMIGETIWSKLGTIKAAEPMRRIDLNVTTRLAPLSFGFVRTI